MAKILIHIDRGILDNVYIQKDGSGKAEVQLIDTDDHCAESTIIRDVKMLEADDIEEVIVNLTIKTFKESED